MLSDGLAEPMRYVRKGRMAGGSNEKGKIKMMMMDYLKFYKYQLICSLESRRGAESEAALNVESVSSILTLHLK